MKDENEILDFRQFLEKSVNLFTIMGVCGAFMLVPIDLKNRVANFTIPLFFHVTFLLTSIEILRFCKKSDNGSFKFDVFFWLFVMFCVGSIAAFIAKFGDVAIFLFSITFYCIICAGAYLIYIRFIEQFLISKSKKQYSKAFKSICFILLTATLLLFIFSRFGSVFHVAVRVTKAIQSDTTKVLNQ